MTPTTYKRAAYNHDTQDDPSLDDSQPSERDSDNNYGQYDNQEEE